MIADAAIGTAYAAIQARRKSGRVALNRATRSIGDFLSDIYIDN